MRQNISAILTLCLCFLLIPALNARADFYNVGFRTLGHWDGESGLRLDVNLWYPSVRPPRDFQYGPWEISAARGGKAVEGRFPLILLSHDTAGSRFSYHDTAAWLAASGFVVAAPTHPGDNMDNMDLLLTWQQLSNRVRELSSLIPLLLNDPEAEPTIDPDRIGVLGFGAGGTAALLLGGALPDCEGWQNYCAQAGTHDMYCNVWAKNRMEGLCRSLPLSKSLADTRIKAVAAVAPGFGMLFNRDSFRWFYPPLLLMAASNDGLNNTALHARRIYEFTGKKARWLVLDKADAGALMAPCPPALEAELPELCRSVREEDRKNIHKNMFAALSEFFLHYLGSGKNLPQIPAPPDLSPPLPPKPEPAPVPAQPAKRSRAK
ncbi:MAG: dienelactone hydrolase family protein [Desulfovibrio sp.]|uniref:alpha/beta hydrolase family protein n=1 Tax=Desulfovibrio sp. TaxID=885 RepID=UPI0039E30DD4